jgi:parallel beta-helix repeat protein
MRKIIFTLFSSVLLIASLFTSANAETTKCTSIKKLPATINNSGVYCLTNSLSTTITTGSAITIAASNVVFDLNGFSLDGSSAGMGTTAFGISAEQRQNVTVKNGIVRGFLVGIYFGDDSPYTTSRANVIEEIRADKNTYVGIYIKGEGSVIRNNIVSGTGGTTVTGRDGETVGIGTQGANTRVLGNDVMDLASEGEYDGVGISVFDGTNCIVAGNRVSNITADPGVGAGIALGGNLSGVVVSDNRLSGMNSGIYFLDATGTYMNNLVLDTTTPYTGGTAAGGTNY